MGTGWRRAFCTKAPTDEDTSFEEENDCLNPSPRKSSKMGFFRTTSSNPSTPRLQSSPSLRCRTTKDGFENGENNLNSPKLRCKTTANSPRRSNPSSPRSPFSIFKNSLRISKNYCGVCMQNVKRGQGMAIYTAECSHSFHFPCITAHVKKQNSLVCPVCNTTWKDQPLLNIHKVSSNENKSQDRKISSPSKISSPGLQDLLPKKCSDVGKAYRDDEPLVTPRAGCGAFVTIPEVDEMEDGNDSDSEEFKGFVTNHVSSSADEILANELRNVEVKLMPEAVVVSTSRTHETYAVVLKVKAPPPPPPLPVLSTQKGRSMNCPNPSRRAPIDLVAVLDVGTSMGGPKLQMMKRAMRLVISSLGSADRLSIVVFSAYPKRLLPLKRMTAQGQRSARRIIDRLVCSPGYCAADALRNAAKVLEDRRERNPVATIILLSDGQEQENNANARQESNQTSTTRFAHVEIPANAFQEPAENAFAKCVGGLLSVVVQDLRVQLNFANGSDPGKITAVYSFNGRPALLGSSCIRLGDLYAEEEREFLVEMQVPKRPMGSHQVLSVRCSYSDPATQEIIHCGEKALLVPRPQTVRLGSCPKLEQLKNVFIATRAVAESRQLVEHNEFTTAQQLISSARALLIQSGSADEYVRGLEVELSDIQWRRQHKNASLQYKDVRLMVDENGEPLTPTSAWRAAEMLANVALVKKSLNKVSDLHGFENARF